MPPIPPTTSAFLLLFAATVLAVRQRDLTFVLDAAFVLLYARYPLPATLALIGVQALVRRVPTLSRECAVLLNIHEPAGWTLHALLFLFPGLRAYAASPQAPGATLAPSAPATGATVALRPATPLPMASWWPLVQDQPDKHPHALVLGPSGQGKSWLMEAFSRTRDSQVLVIQPNKRLDDWQDISVVQCDDDGSFVPIARAIEWIRAEFARRGGAMKTGDPGPWLTIVWDELPLCIDQLGDLTRRTIIQLITAGRPRKLRLIGGSNSARVNAIGLDGFGDLTFSCAIISIGSFAVAKVPALEAIRWPACLEVDGRAAMAVDRSAVSQLLHMPVAPGQVIELAPSAPSGLNMPKSALIAAPSVSGRPDRQTDEANRAALKQQRIEQYAGMRAMGYNRDDAAEKIRREGGTFDNNEWRDAGELLAVRMGAATPKKGKRASAPTP
jgi:hypothetical protein